MLLTLDNFEQSVEPKIIARSLDYFENGDLARLEKVGDGGFSAVVLGSDRYEVFVRLDGKYEDENVSELSVVE